MKKLFLFAILLTFAVFAGCQKDKNSENNNKTDQHNLQEKTEQPADFEHVYPLTGIGTDQPVDDRIVGVMINNHRKARPQTGLTKADIVFEILAEGRITRFLALFQSEKPEMIGPVRSAREYYFKLAAGYDALYIYHGAANFVNDMIRDRGIEHLNGSLHDNDGVLFKRGTHRKAPHNSYLLFDAVYNMAKDKGYAVKADVKPLPFLSEKEADSLDGSPGQHVKIVYADNKIVHNIVEFNYDADTGRYTRFDDGEKTVDLKTNDPVQVDNVFVLETHHEIIDDAGRRAVDMESGGNALLFQKGIVREVQWENRDGQIIPVVDGKPAGFVPGKTWINVIPDNPGIAKSVAVSND